MNTTNQIIAKLITHANDKMDMSEALLNDAKTVLGDILNIIRASDEEVNQMLVEMDCDEQKRTDADIKPNGYHREVGI